MEPLTAISQLVGIGKVIADYFKKHPDKELASPALTLLPLIAQLQSEYAQLEKENRELRAKTDTAARWRATRAKLKFEDSAYWLVEEGSKDGPFCPTCADADEKLVRLMPNPVKAKGVLTCNIHKDTPFYTSEYKHPGPALAIGSVEGTFSRRNLRGF